jgi:hypothetical protein
MFLPNDYHDRGDAKSLDFSMATVATKDFLFRFTRRRGELSVQISLPGTPRKWEGLDAALTWLDFQQALRADPSLWGDLRAMDRFLHGHWNRLQLRRALSSIENS